MSAKSALRKKTLDPADATGISVAEGLHRAGRGPASLIFLDGQLTPQHVEYGELDEMAEDTARRLRRRGVAAGDRVCFLAPSSLPVLATLFGLWRLGAVPVVLAPPRRGTQATVLHRIGQWVRAAEPSLVMTTRELAPQMERFLSHPVMTMQQLRQTVPAGPAPRMPLGDAPGLLQFTASGGTATPRPVLLRQDQLVGNIAALGAHTGFGTADRFSTWLPLYHPMGIAFLAAMIAMGAEAVMMAPETYLEHPDSWLRTITDYQATVTAAPASGYALAAKEQRTRPAALNLRGLRVALNGTEPIDADGLASTVRVLHGVGMPAKAMCPVYGPAETTLAISAGTGRRPVRMVSPAQKGERGERTRVSHGLPLADVEVEIHDESGRALPAGTVGRIAVRVPGVTEGQGSPDGRRDPASARSGWLETGDTGFTDAGELVVCGRAEDVPTAATTNLVEPASRKTAHITRPGLPPKPLAAA